MRVLIAVLSALVLVAAAGPRAAARDGGYLLVDPLFGGIEGGAVVIRYLHLTLAGDRIEARFIAPYAPWPDACESGTGPCDQIVHALDMRVEEREGRLTLLSHVTRLGPGVVIDRPDVDLGFFVMPLLALVGGAGIARDGAVLTLSRPERQGEQGYRFVALELDAALDAVRFAASFEISLAPLDYCIVRQIAGLRHDPRPGAAARQVLDAQGFVAGLAALRAEFERAGRADAEADARMRLGARLAVRQIALTTGVRHLAEASLAEDADLTLPGRGPDDDALAAVMREGVAGLARSDRPGFAAEAEALLGDDLPGLLGTTRYMARHALLMQRGHDLPTTICRDITLAAAF